MNVISVASEKGGVGKSTSAVTLAAHLAGRDRTLLVDADERLRSAWNWATKKEGYTGWGFDVQLYSDFMGGSQTRARGTNSSFWTPRGAKAARNWWHWRVTPPC